MKAIKIINGIPYFEVDGEIIPPTAYMTYLTHNAEYGAFYKAGFRLFCLCVQASSYPGNEKSGLSGGFTPETWKEENRFDFSALDGNVLQLLEQTGDKNVKIILRINLNMPRWWREKYPEELTLFENGAKSMQSIFSERWRGDACRFLDALKLHIEESGYRDNVIAWQPSAMHTEEWIAPSSEGAIGDTSAAAKKAFILFLQKKYVRTDALNKAWGCRYSAFNEIDVPTAEEFAEIDGQIGQKARDYFVCMNDAYAETADCFCSYIKRIFHGDIFAGCFSGYIAQLDRSKGHCSFSKLVNSKNVDFFASPFAYTGARANSVDWIYHAPMETAKKAGKLWFIEADVRTHNTQSLSKCAPQLFPHRIAYYEDHPVWFGPDKKNSYRNMLRSFAKVFISRNAFWWFDMWGGWYNDQEYMELIGKTRAIYEKELFEKIESVCEIAVALDERSSYFISDTYFYQSVYDKIVSLGYMGAPYDLLLSNHSRLCDFARYKVVIFTAPVMTEEFKRLADALKQDGKTVIITSNDKTYAETFETTLDDSKISEIASAAGVHIYSAGNIVYANEKYVCVTARKDGRLSVSMPYHCTLVDCITQEEYRTVDGAIDLEAESNQTFLFEIFR